MNRPTTNATAETARQGIANAVDASREAGPRAHVLVRAARESFVDGWQRTMWAGVVIMGALLLYLLVRGPQRPASAADEPEPTATIAS
ncbi:hypothetical protein ACIRP3_19950 [Streptomyces sp. NPDC101209]|uniref:hypothetical protein n=1 Tax=Streptomyces sp. NPDC101209 TaxID=3366129 RepID=UPI003828E9FD